MANDLSVPHFPQSVDGSCLPACAQMVLTYLGIVCSQADLARQLGTRPRIGTPQANIERLRSLGLDVIYVVHGDAEALRELIKRRLPAIVFVQTSELPYWHGHVSRHALVVVGIDNVTVRVLDPAMAPEPLTVPLGDFMLAWDEVDNTCAVISVRE